VELSFLHRLELIVPKLGGQVMQDLTRISVVFALSAAAIYHIAVLIALATVLT
jgi:hypothetical protein